MTDKQIIDRVNVKECKYYYNGKCERYEEFVEADYANYSVKCICEKENDLFTYDICDYQQLKRKEQEVDVLKAENERLKQAFAESDNDCFRLEKENRLLKIYRSISPLKVKMLVQTLDEIKAIAKQYTEVCVSGQSIILQYKLEGKEELARIILQKISEVDDESYLDNHWLFTKEKGED